MRNVYQHAKLPKIIQPDDRADSDSNFYESWLDRKARKAAEQPKNPAGRPRGSGKLANGTRSDDPVLLTRFKAAYIRGHSYKIICRDLGLSISKAGEIRRQLGLPTRQPPRGQTPREHEFTARFSEQLWAAIEKRCHEKGIRKAKYITWLIQRDLGL